MPTLTLSRNVGERILIGDDTIVEVKEVRKNQVRIAITAPEDTQIDREETRTKKHLQWPQGHSKNPNDPYSPWQCHKHTNAHGKRFCHECRMRRPDQ